MKKLFLRTALVVFALQQLVGTSNKVIASNLICVCDLAERQTKVDNIIYLYTNIFTLTPGACGSLTEVFTLLSITPRETGSVGSCFPTGGGGGPVCSGGCIFHYDFLVTYQCRDTITGIVRQITKNKPVNIDVSCVPQIIGIGGTGKNENSPKTTDSLSSQTITNNALTENDLNVNIYPNPVSDSHFFIGLFSNGTSIKEQASIKMYNLMGQEINLSNSESIIIGNEKSTFQTVDLPPNIASGTFIVKVSLGNKTETKLINVIQK